MHGHLQLWRVRVLGMSKGGSSLGFVYFVSWQSSSHSLTSGALLSINLAVCSRAGTILRPLNIERYTPNLVISWWLLVDQSKPSCSLSGVAVNH